MNRLGVVCAVALTGLLFSCGKYMNGPITEPDTATTLRAQPVLIDVLANDKDAHNDTSFTLASGKDTFIDQDGLWEIKQGEVLFSPFPQTLGNVQTLYDLCKVYSTGLICSEEKITVDVQNRGREISGIMRQDTTLTAKDGPYFVPVGSLLQITSGVNLTLEPGAELYGSFSDFDISSVLNGMDIFGSLTLHSNSKDSAKLVGFNIGLNDDSILSIEGSKLDHANIIFREQNISLNLQNSEVGNSWLRIPGINNVKLENNNFLTTIIDLSCTYSPGNFEMKRNLIRKISIGVGFNPCAGSIAGNTFKSEKAGFSTYSNINSPATLDLSGNYWSTNNESEIEDIIQDSNDDLNIKSTVIYKPFLTAPDPATPVP